MRNNFLFKSFLLVIFSLIITCKTLPALENKILLKVNNEIITTIDIFNEANYLKFLNPKISTLDNNRLMESAKSSLIRDKIKTITLLELVDEINIGEENIKKIITSMYKSRGMNSLKEYKSLLKNYDLDIEFIKNKINIDSLWNEMIFKKYRSKVLINKEEITKEVLNNPDEKLFLSEILFSASSKDQTKDKYQKIKSDISKEGFENAALIHSIADSSSIGGEIGWVDKSSLNKNIYQEISKIKIGEYTKPILTPGGFLILKVIDIKKDEIKKEDLNKKINRLIRIKTNQQLNQFSNIFLNKLRKDLIINEL